MPYLTPRPYKPAPPTGYITLTPLSRMWSVITVTSLSRTYNMPAQNSCTTLRGTLRFKKIKHEKHKYIIQYAS